MTEKSGGSTPAKKKGARSGSEPQQKITSGGGPAVVAAEKANKRRVTDYKTHAKKLISVEFPEIMEAMAKKSVGGSLAHTKYLFELGGVKQDIERRSRGKAEPSLAELLVAEIRRKKLEELPAFADESATGDSAAASTADEKDERGGHCGAREL